MKRLYTFFLLSVVGLFFYSFTQIDLGLAITRIPILFSIQRAFQTIGYFNRPLSSLIFIIILILLFISYFLFIKYVNQDKIERKNIWKLILITSGILVFSYNAFSYDLFNYIFDAKILTFYGKNPYLYKALDFPGDPMLSFMHWTHRVYPYGPVWLGVTIPLSLLGLNKFILNFFLFKALAAGCFIGSAYFVEKIIKRINPKNSLLALTFFAFNPMIIIESLVSAHLDILMVFLVLVSLFLLVNKKYFWAILFLILSIGTKYATVFIVPIFFVVLVLQFMKLKVPWELVSKFSIMCLFVSVIAASGQSGNFQPWYLIVIFPFIAMISFRKVIQISAVILSFGSLLTYLPYLYFGNWDKPVPELLRIIYASTAVLIIIVWAAINFSQIKSKKYLK